MSSQIEFASKTSLPTRCLSIAAQHVCSSWFSADKVMTTTGRRLSVIALALTATNRKTGPFHHMDANCHSRYSKRTPRGENAVVHHTYGKVLRRLELMAIKLSLLIISNCFLRVWIPTTTSCFFDAVSRAPVRSEA